MKIDVVLNPSEISTLKVEPGATCVVFDVLRATSSMVTALAYGAREIFPVRTIEEALALRAKVPEAALAGERHGDRIDGFDLGNSPLEFRENVPERIITTTTNGTIALRACDGASEILVGALLNLDAVIRHLRARNPALLRLICAGTFEETALEDVIAAGLVCEQLPEAELTDSAVIAQATARRFGGAEGLYLARNGRALLAKGRRNEIEWCARISSLDVLAAMEFGVVRRIDV